MQLIEREISQKPEYTKKLKSMKVDKKMALSVSATDVTSMRVTISYLHKNTKLQFQTEKDGDGILVWRIK